MIDMIYHDRLMINHGLIDHGADHAQHCGSMRVWYCVSVVVWYCVSVVFGSMLVWYCVSEVVW